MAVTSNRLAWICHTGTWKEQQIFPRRGFNHIGKRGVRGIRLRRMTRARNDRLVDLNPRRHSIQAPSGTPTRVRPKRQHPQKPATCSQQYISQDQSVLKKVDLSTTPVHPAQAPGLTRSLANGRVKAGQAGQPACGQVPRWTRWAARCWRSAFSARSALSFDLVVS